MTWGISVQDIRIGLTQTDYADYFYARCYTALHFALPARFFEMTVSLLASRLVFTLQSTSDRSLQSAASSSIALNNYFRKFHRHNNLVIMVDIFKTTPTGNELTSNSVLI